MEHILFLITIFLGFAFYSGRCSDVYSRNDFPEGFVFGSAFSAFQWEGAVDEDGKKPSIWDTFINSSKLFHKPKILEDVRLMYDMGLDAFQLSISWPRLIPNAYGRSPVNPKGLQFYKNFINELTRHGIEPHVTLYHNDLPQALEDEYGGWIDRKIIEDFTAFADVCFREFGNAGGYDLGFVPPVHCSPPFGMVNCSRGNSSTEPYIALHNMLLAHASTASLYKQKYKDKQSGSVGITCFAYWMIPFTSSEEDKIATQRAKDFLLGWVLHPLVFGDYPEVMKRIVGKRLPSFSEEESDLVKDSSDFLGLIHYTTTYVSHLSIAHEDFVSDMSCLLIRELFFPRIFCFDVLPWGLEGVLEYLKQNYHKPPVYILENGSETRGYFQWSVMDLYEFLDYNYTYGLYYVNFSDPERKRSPKTSALWYSALLKGSL
ncbi:hypothetical protein EUTSA_v10003058mg, partial [Eutrema salsugineum]